MGFYAQTDYPQIQGIDGRYSIAQVGSFLVAGSHLLQKFGMAISPKELNELFIERQVYMASGDGICDDLGWASFTAAGGHIQVGHISDPGAWPDTDNAIVKFHYQSSSQPYLSNGQANMLDHFCLVADAAAHTIVDSWDGQVKTAGSYGDPVAYASYTATVPHPVRPLPNVPAPIADIVSPAIIPALPGAPVTAPSLTDKYLVVQPLPSYPAASLAFSGTDSNGTVQPGSYYVHRRFNDMLNITLIPGQPSWWVNPKDNVIIHPSVPDALPNKWKGTYRPFKDANGDSIVKKYQVAATIDVQDLAGQRKDKRIYVNESYDFAGAFTGPDGYEYYRPEGAATAHLWYGADPQYLTLVEEPGTTEAYIETAAHRSVRPLSATEQVWVGISKAASYYPKVMELIKQRRRQ